MTNIMQPTNGDRKEWKKTGSTHKRSYIAIKFHFSIDMGKILIKQKRSKKKRTKKENKKVPKFGPSGTSPKIEKF
jgi:hypothetical protein